MTVSIEIISDVGEILSRMCQWRELQRKCGTHPFSSAEWIEAWFAAWPNPTVRPAFGFAWDDDTLVAGWPLGVSKKRTSKFGPEVMTLHPLCDDKSGFHEMLQLDGYDGLTLDILAAYREAISWAVLDLYPIEDSAPTRGLLNAARCAGSALRQRSEISTARADLSEGWPAYLATRSRDFRKSLRATSRKLETLNHNFTMTCSDTAADRSKLAKAIVLSGKCWKSEIGTDLASDPALGQFIRALFDGMGPSGDAWLYLLEIDDAPAASLILLRHKTKSYALVNDFDEQFSSLSLGRYVLARAIEHAAETGVTQVDFLRATPFTQRFATCEASLMRVRIARKWSLAAVWLGAEDTLRPIGKSFRRKRQLANRKRVAHKNNVLKQLNDRDE